MGLKLPVTCHGYVGFGICYEQFVQLDLYHDMASVQEYMIGVFRPVLRRRATYAVACRPTSELRKLIK